VILQILVEDVRNIKSWAVFVMGKKIISYSKIEFE
jgi:hypothetical protein